MDAYPVARIDAANVVVNLEVVTDEWMEAAAPREGGYRFIPYNPASPVRIGWTYNEQTGRFDDPEDPTPTPLPAQEA